MPCLQRFMRYVHDIVCTQDHFASSWHWYKKHVVSIKGATCQPYIGRLTKQICFKVQVFQERYLSLHTMAIISLVKPQMLDYKLPKPLWFVLGDTYPGCLQYHFPVWPTQYSSQSTVLTAQRKVGGWATI